MYIHTEYWMTLYIVAFYSQIYTTNSNQKYLPTTTGYRAGVEVGPSTLHLASSP